MKRKTARPYRLDQTGLVAIPKAKISKTSDALDWSDVNVSLIGTEACGASHQGALPDLNLSMPLDPIDVAAMLDGRQQSLTILRNRPNIIAPGTPLSVEWRGAANILSVFVRRDVLAEVSGELFGRDTKSLEVISTVGVEDRSISQLLHLLQDALHEPKGHANLKVEHISRALVAHVLRRHSNIMDTGQGADVPLTNRQVKLAKEHIREHLASKILLKDLAPLLNLGRTSLLKRFGASFRQTPHQYILEQRVSRAKELLEGTNLSLEEIAASCGFSDRTHLGNIFRRFVGMAPAQYRQLRKS